VVSVLLSVPIPGTSRETQLREERKMAKLDESEGEVLSREEMKKTKGGLGVASEALVRERTAADAPKTVVEGGFRSTGGGKDGFRRTEDDC
jgi:hypothetical protein